MSGRDQELEDDRRTEAGRWLAVALADVRVVHLCLDADEPVLGIAAYHCQQAAEKAVKGMLVMAAIPFAKTHDMARLGDLAASHYPNWRHVLTETERLTVWGHAYRYPGLEEVAEPEPSSDILLAALASQPSVSSLAICASLFPRATKPEKSPEAQLRRLFEFCLLGYAEMPAYRKNTHGQHHHPGQ